MRNLMAAAIVAMIAVSSAVSADDQPASTDRCAATPSCTQHGRCFEEGSRCVARREADCAASTACRDQGLHCELAVEVKRCVSEPEEAKPYPFVPGGEDVSYASVHPNVVIGSLLIVLGVASGVASGVLFATVPEDGDTSTTLEWTAGGVSAAVASLVSTSIGICQVDDGLRRGPYPTAFAPQVTFRMRF